MFKSSNAATSTTTIGFLGCCWLFSFLGSFSEISQAATVVQSASEELPISISSQEDVSYELKRTKKNFLYHHNLSSFTKRSFNESLIEIIKENEKSFIEPENNLESLAFDIIKASTIHLRSLNSQKFNLDEKMVEEDIKNLNINQNLENEEQSFDLNLNKDPLIKLSEILNVYNENLFSFTLFIKRNENPSFNDLNKTSFSSLKILKVQLGKAKSKLLVLHSKSHDETFKLIDYSSSRVEFLDSKIENGNFLNLPKIKIFESEDPNSGVIKEILQINFQQ